MAQPIDQGIGKTPSPLGGNPDAFISRGWRRVLVGVAYVISGIVLFLIADLAGSDIIGGGSAIHDPVAADRIDNLVWTAGMLWIAGAVTLLIGNFLLGDSPEDSGMRPRWRWVTIGAMIGLPLIWLLFSIWVIQETKSAVDASKPSPTPAASLARPAAPMPRRDPTFSVASGSRGDQHKAARASQNIL